MARNSGLSQTSTKGKPIPTKKIGAGCGVQCRYKYKDKISEDQRVAIFTEYYARENVDWKRDVIAQMVDKSM